MSVRFLAFGACLMLCGAAMAQTPGPDIINGEDVPETLRGLAGPDVINGNAGHDEIYGGSGDDTIHAGRGRDAVSGGAGNDMIFGDEADDTLNGGEGDDVIEGGEGGDLMYGDAGADSLYGGVGNDYLYGGPGADWLHGGGGADQFRFEAGDNAPGAPDTIADFNRREGDRIDLSRIHEDAAFTIVRGDFTKAPMQLIIEGGPQSTLRFDVDGDGEADGEIIVATEVRPEDIDR